MVSPPALGIYISSSPYARIGGYAYSWTLIQVHPCSKTHTHTHRKGLFYEVNVNKSRFFFRSLHCFFSLSFLCFSHIETTPHQISYPSQVSPPQRTNHSQITSHCELIDPGFPGIIAQFKSGRFLRCGRGVFFFFYVREGGSVCKKNEVE